MPEPAHLHATGEGPYRGLVLSVDGDEATVSLDIEGERVGRVINVKMLEDVEAAHTGIPFRAYVEPESGELLGLERVEVEDDGPFWREPYQREIKEYPTDE